MLKCQKAKNNWASTHFTGSYKKKSVGDLFKNAENVQGDENEKGL